ncbi:Abi-alpha family protein [Rhizobium lentis]|uniref:Abi-alpha family protein n=1 Tax=Rhizobium lentis TaxID=1138194 RepID=UPI001A91ED7B|nr:Abi-alpha family protein [Rhizobium lentis]MBX5063343.1 DUF4393 domain-containing protein [Rhizobium lentis]MBX5075448.1 DUF4393 domain-containing protein [Rhizobium lentis]QSW93099.1 DUF4393 domain-containing protein [Rhizobium lentis]
MSGDKTLEMGAKAAEEIAKTAAVYQPTIHDAVAFLQRLIAPVEQGAGLLADYIKGRRLELAIKQEARIRELMRERGVSSIKPMALSTAVPLIEAATLEEDDDMARMFANLIVSHISDSGDGYVPKQFTDTLRQMSPLEAAILKAMGSAPDRAVNESGMMYTASLPHSYLDAPGPKDKDVPEPNRSISLALASLRQSGCIEGALAWGGFTLLSQARVTEYGRAFLDAVSPSSSK